MLRRDDNIYFRIGIYGIRNLLNGKIYVGKTGMNFGDRWDSHRSLLNNGKHDNPHLQRAWDKNHDGIKHIILLTDGGENCDESPCDYAIELMKQRRDIKSRLYL